MIRLLQPRGCAAVWRTTPLSVSVSVALSPALARSHSITRHPLRSSSRPATHIRCNHTATGGNAQPTGAHSNSSGVNSDSSVPSSPVLPFAVVGSGPAAFYTAKYLLREVANCRVDMFERLPVPYGLVRFGVAPDHPDVKSVTNDFAQVASDARFGFWGNVEIGKEIQIEELRKHYSAVVLAYGAASERTLDIPGSHLKGIHPSRHFVNWYNGHPEHGADAHDFSLSSVRTAVIIGQGNVAIDCARVLLSPLTRLQRTDISTHALTELATSGVSSVHMLGRRGAVQSAFSIGELRELATSVEGIRVCMDPTEFALSENAASLSEIETSRPKKRKHELMKQILANSLPSQVTPTDATTQTKDLHIRYLLSPKEFLPSDKQPDRVGAIVLEKTELRGQPEHQEAVPTGETITIPTELVLTSIGYKSIAIPGVPFDTRKHIIPSKAGRVQSLTGESLPGVYVAGWVKRGPSGIIATNIMDARETVKSIRADILSGDIQEPQEHTQIPFLTPDSIAAHHVVTRAAWNRIDSYEQELGLQHGTPRVKLTNKQKMLEAAGIPHNNK